MGYCSPQVPVREKLLSARTYFVRTDGNDSNTGLANSSGGAFLTIQKAVNVLTSFDSFGLSHTITVGAGTFTGAVVLGFIQGGGTITINGAGSTTIISVTGNNCISGSGALGDWVLTNVTLTPVTILFAILLQRCASLRISGITFGAITTGFSHMLAITGAIIQIEGNYTISGGGGTAHMYAQQLGMIRVTAASTITISANITLSFFALCEGGSMVASGLTYSLGAFTVTAQRYVVNVNGVINTNAGGANYFPGTTDGAVATGGQYG